MIVNEKPQKRKTGLVVRPEERRLKIELFPLDQAAWEFMLDNTTEFGVTYAHGIHNKELGGRILHVHPAYDFNEVVAYFKSYNEPEISTGMALAIDYHRKNGW